MGSSKVLSGENGLFIIVSLFTSYVLAISVSILVIYCSSPSFAVVVALGAGMTLTFALSSLMVVASENSYCSKSLLALPVVALGGIVLGESFERNLFVDVLGFSLVSIPGPQRPLSWPKRL